MQKLRYYCSARNIYFYTNILNFAVLSINTVVVWLTELIAQNVDKAVVWWNGHKSKVCYLGGCVTLFHFVQKVGRRAARNQDLMAEKDAENSW